METDTETLPSEHPVFSSRLDYSQKLNTDISVSHVESIRYNPVTSLSSSNTNIIQFHVPSHQFAFTCLRSSRLFVKCKIVKSTGAALDSDDNVVYCNNFLSSLFSQVTVHFNSKLVYSADCNYHYKSMIEKLCTSQYASKDELFQIEGTNGEPGAEDVTTRQLRTNASAVFEVSGPIYADVFQTSKYLPNGISMDIKLEKNLDKFFLLSPQDAKVYNLQILDIYLLVNRVHLSPQVFNYISASIAKTPAILPYKGVVTRTFGIPLGSFTSVQERLFSGRLPSVVVFGLVSSTSYLGKQSKNGFNFQNFSISKVALSTDAISQTNNYTEFDFRNSKYLEGFIKFSQAIGNDKQLVLNRDSWFNGKTLHAFTLSPKASDQTLPPAKTGAVRLQIDFSAATTEAIIAVVLGVFDNALVVDNERDVSII